MAPHECITCHKKKPGRFTRRKLAAGGGWSQKLSLPYYYCFTCLPQGNGTDEDEQEAPVPVATPKAQTALSVRVDPAVRAQGESMITPLADLVQSLVVDSDETYLEAEGLLHRIITARKTWGERMEKIIRPIRTGLDEIYSLNRSIDKPLGVLEDNVRKPMKAYKMEELRLIRAAEDEKRREEDRLRREAEDKALAAEQARTAQMRGKLQAQAQRAVEQAEVVAQAEVPTAIRGFSSGTRTRKIARVDDFHALLKGILDGYVPDDAVMINQTAINKAFREDPEGMAAWPGVVIEDDVQIVGR